MKIALYVEDGLEQIVLTPENETENGIIGKMHDDSRELSVYRGEFYGCRGGWVRWQLSSHSIYGTKENDKSTIIVLRRKKGESAEYRDSPEITETTQG